MYGYCKNRRLRNLLLAALRTLIVNSVVWPIGVPLGFAVLLALPAALVGLNPVDFALVFLSEAAIGVFAVAANLWAGIFWAATLCFGIGWSLPYLLQHRSLSADGIARLAYFTTVRVALSHEIGALCGSTHKWRIGPIRPSRTALCTASDLAGAVPRLE